MTLRRFPGLFSLILFAVNGFLIGRTAQDYRLLPWPTSVVEAPGHFSLSSETPVVPSSGAEDTARLLVELFRQHTGLGLSVRESDTQVPFIRLDLDPALEDRFGPEGYRLEIRPTKIRIAAAGTAGLVFGTQTLLQLAPGLDPTAGTRGVQGSDEPPRGIPALTIEDRPRFEWRGLMLDCSRTFHSLDYLYRTVDRMSALKLNVLHLHLTDDQGWRLEIRRFPQLTEKGARFPARFNEAPEHQGFYTREQMRRLVAYAERRGVAILPEIEMPGHSLAALSCFPELSCTGGPFEIFPFFKGPNITEDLLCAGNEKTFDFIEQVLSEVVEIFPFRYVHVGGDESPKTRWKACPKCQARIRSEGLSNEEELQGYFIRRAQKILAAHGRQLIGWTEIVDGGLAPGAAVMNWLGSRGADAAARGGQPIVMSPTSHCYFDYAYKDIDTRRAYGYEPVPDYFSPDQARLILGLQANFWSHIDRSPDRVDAQLFPRLLAIAERGWSAEGVRDWDSFLPRLRERLEILRASGVNLYPDPSLQTQPSR